MGARGPRPTPTRVLQMRGTFRKDRHGDPATEPDFELVTEMPPPPGFLDPVAVMEWDRVGPHLIEQQLLTVGDLAAFTLYCLNVSRVVACEKAINEKGLLIEAFGGMQANPAIAIGRQAGVEVRKFCQEFGMTPSARTRVKVPPKEKEKPKTGWGAVANGGGS